MDVAEWVASYRRAWEDRDADAAVALFTEDAEYRSNPFQEPDRRSEGVRDYWTRVTATQGDVEVRMGTPFVDGNRVAVEFWTTMLNDGAEVTLTGCMLLTLAPDGRCEKLREYWHYEPGDRTPPHDGWGA
jgi:ketosteroid isomerase-like protein